MYPNLAIPELVEQIVSYLDPSKNRRSLVVLARTASIFHNPAIAILWQSQTDLLNTLRCLPPDLYRLDVVKQVVEGDYDHYLGDVQNLRLVRLIEVSDWERVRLHANHVREFSYRPTYADRYSKNRFSYSSIHAVLALNFMDSGIFPNLTDLDWTCYDDDFDADFLHIRLFLVPKITRIDIRCRKQTHSVMLSLLPQRCPLLKDAFITFDYEPVYADELSTVASNNITKFILGLCCVEYLTSHIPNIVSLLHLARLSTLRYLGVSGLPEALSTVDVTSIPNPFPSLRQLHIREGANMTSVIRLLEVCRNVALETFTVQNTIPSPAIAPLLAALVNSSHFSLTRLEIRGFQDHNIMTFEVLRPALDLVNLAEVMFSLGSDLDDAAITQMAQAWPRLRILEFQPCDDRRSWITIGCLRSLAQWCPELENLRMTFSLGVIPAFVEAPPAQSRLRSLGVNRSRITGSQTIDVARFISAVFPNVTKVSTDWETYSDEGKSFGSIWKEVETYIPLVKQIRAEAKSWALESRQ
ncbi:hypothetical protein FB45DRAFT_1020088 [Roridomyces roridus]|uniref:F-box domain-containing protein n=1 Tax=Roridomyces roridus TaxID=1738132 RepID=A0AAD7CGA3_9AGAR|nr:hypothetical protein FB45DRAFT_1020088 [Roridomyces roridus]